LTRDTFDKAKPALSLGDKHSLLFILPSTF